MLLVLSGDNRTVFAVSEAQAVLNLNAQSLSRILRNLHRKGWIKRLERGKYLIIPLEGGEDRETIEHNFVIAQALISPSAIAFWSALHFHNLTEQIPGVVYLATPRRKYRRDQEVLGTRVRTVLIAERYFFGLQPVWFGSQRVTVTDPEKTLIDALYLPGHCGGMEEVVKAYRDGGSRLDWTKIRDYLQKFSKPVLYKRLGVIGCRFNFPVEITDFCKKNAGSSVSYFDPRGPKAGRTVRGWGLKMNFPLEAY